MPHDPQQLDLMDELFATTSFDRVVDWGKFPDLGLDPDEVDLPEHIGDYLQADQDAKDMVHFSKSAQAQRLATGWASVLTHPDGSPVYDREGDSIDESELSRAVDEFMRLPAEQRNVGDTHHTTSGIGQVVESLVITKSLKNALGLPVTFPTGWLVTVHVTNEAVWNKIAAGEYKSFSVGGSGKRTPVA